MTVNGSMFVKVPSRSQADVVVVGGGLSGSLAAVLLGRAGYRVAFVDRHAVCPAQFRVEKIAGVQVELLRRMGLLDCLAAAGAPFVKVVNARRGRVLDETFGQHYGILYDDMVRVVREQLPPAVRFLVDRVVQIETGPDHQQVTLAGGEVISARLVVLATGMGDLLRQDLGISRRVIFEKHSTTFGFSISPAPGQAFGFPSLTYYGEQQADAIDYLTLFPVGDVMRANLFTYRDYRDPWLQDMRRDPKSTLLATLPGLGRFLGDFQVVTPVQYWIMDLCVAGDYERDGVVLIGDVFQTSCPAAGTGVSRLLTDVERLCMVHLPRWLASPGMGREKVSEFYQDPAKQAADRSALRAAHYRRGVTVDPGMGWTLRRQHAFIRRRLLGRVKDLQRALPAPSAGQAEA
ncbi:FAD-dependent monooxygenase [Phenylobacterium hankyongense]|uniref:FAD-dependent monooxygenase n=1 Tax=Phenylobacterium hankyongense TaxID=1813876 RepID=A0A328B4E5_9CAUL|nr:NAD(P)/FAD-dependent oxidoreductase [Phenylobacterium hankyongense]RAK60734.1 FAD-dependent monooxygenase [Phenylobacterium hankyongense]